MSASILIAPEVTTRVAAVRYEESTKGSFWFIAKGVILTLLTVGIYRFWFTTAIRKNLWARAFIDGSPAEYTGKAHELLLGFLVALAVLLPAYVVVFVATMYLPDPSLGFLVAYLLLFLLVQFARYRARRYITSRTLWRGIRFRQDGSALTYTALAAGWWLVTLATLGVAYPFMRASLERYRMNHTLLGETRFASEADGLSVMFNWMIVYALSIMPILGCIGVLLAAGNFNHPIDFTDGETLSFKVTTLIIAYRSIVDQKYTFAISATFIGGGGLGVLLGPYYWVQETQTFLRAIKFNEARLNVNIASWRVYLNYVKFFAVIIIILFAMFVLSVMLMIISDLFEAKVNVFFLAGLVSVYLVFPVCFLTIPWLHFRFLQVGRLAIIAETLSIRGGDALDATAASIRKIHGGLAEGVADAVDPGGIEIGF